MRGHSRRMPASGKPDPAADDGVHELGPVVATSTRSGGRGWTPERGGTGAVAVHLVEVLGVDRKMRVWGQVDERIAAVARRQRGRVSRRQLTQAGVKRDSVRHRVRRGQLHPLEPRVFAVGHAAPVNLGDETTALLAAGAGALLSHTSAAMLWGMLSPRRGPIHLTVPGGRSLDRGAVVTHRARHLAIQDKRSHGGLPVTSPARVLLDIALRATGRDLELAYDRALVEGILRESEVRELLSRTAGRAQGTVLRALVEGHGSGRTVTRSEAEEMFLALIRAAHLPEPRVNARVAGYEVDFHWPQERLIVEIDGFRYHSTRHRFEHDHRKDSALRAAGQAVLRFTPRQLQNESLATVADVARGLVAIGADGRESA
jgi:very-short-patch-repair endonuclease